MKLLSAALTFGALAFAAIGPEARASMFRIDHPEMSPLLANASPSYKFGAKVSLKGDTLLITGDSSSPGKVFSVFEYQRVPGGWVAKGALPMPGGTQSFGTSLAFDGTRIAVGAPADGPTGTIYLYEHDAGGWVLAETLTGSDVEPGAHYLGGNLVLDGSTLVATITVPSMNAEREAVYVYELGAEGWERETTLMPDYAANWAIGLYGLAMALDDDRLVVGAPATGMHVGYAFAYARNDGLWTEEAVLSPPDNEGGLHFGNSIALSGDTLAISRLSSPQWIDGGAVHVFHREAGNWVEHELLNPPDDESSSQFGHHLAISGDRIVGSTWQHMISGNMYEAAYMYRDLGNGFEFEQAFDIEGRLWDYIGHSLAFDGTTVVLGAPGAEPAYAQVNNDAGVVFAVDLASDEPEPVNAAPEIAPGQVFSIQVNAPMGTPLFPAALNASDPEGDPLTYALENADALPFAIDAGSGALIVDGPVNGDDAATYATLHVHVSDGFSTTMGTISVLLNRAGAPVEENDLTISVTNGVDSLDPVMDPIYDILITNAGLNAMAAQVVWEADLPWTEEHVECVEISAASCSTIAPGASAMDVDLAPAEAVLLRLQGAGTRIDTTQGYATVSASVQSLEGGDITFENNVAADSDPIVIRGIFVDSLE